MDEFISIIVGALLMGVIVGLVPYFIGAKTNRRTLGIIGLLACVLANFIYGLLLSIPVCIVFVIIILIAYKVVK